MRTKRGGAVVAACAVAGGVILVVQLLAMYALATDHHDRAAGSMWLITYVGVPLVALVGARLAPERTGAVATASLAGTLLFFMGFRWGALWPIHSFEVGLLVGYAVLAVATVAMAAVGASLSTRA